MTTELKSWPFLEAQKLLQRINYKIPEKGYLLFETGYGPSGLPHIGTFGEVARTSMVRKAFEILSEGTIPTRFICFSDDLDGLRKVPENIPNPHEYKVFLDQPLSDIPDPFATHKNYADHMNARLCDFLDRFEFQYEFISATHCYKSGLFNKTLLKVLEKFDEIMDLMLPTLGSERQATYSPFLPICKRSNRVLQVPVIRRDLTAGTITYLDPETHEEVTTPVTDGNCKLQWKPDLGMRWAAFEVDFEMYGKDHLVNGILYSKICEILGKKPPNQLFYELFLDEEGKKISKSKGKGFTLDEWLHYAPPETVKLFMFLSPQKAKKLSPSILPRLLDDYLSYAKNYLSASNFAKKDNPLFHLGLQNEKDLAQWVESEISYSLILNLISACDADKPEVVWNYLEKFCPGISKNLWLQKLVPGAINYYQSLLKPYKLYHNPTDEERKILLILRSCLKSSDKNSTAGDLQNELYRIARENNYEMKDWFKLLYQVLLGAESGPRFGTFIALYGIDKTIDLIDARIGVIL
jgi:lysyl-tRNA synthetase class 1